MNGDRTTFIGQKRTGERAAHDRSNTRFTSETAREAAQKSAEVRREKAARRSAEAQLDQLTIRQRLAHELNERKDQIPAILDALYEKAKRGDVPAARELRGWFDQGLGNPGDATLDTGDVDRPFEDMTPEERARLRAGVMKRIAELEAQQVDATDDQEVA